MKKIVKLTCVALILSATANAQQAKKTEAAAQPAPAAFKIKPRLIPWPPKDKKGIIIVGTTDGGTVVESDGVKLLVGTDNQVTPLENIKRSVPIKNKPPVPIVYKLVGTGDNGVDVWAGPDGKSCTLDIAKGTMVDYVGHVTLLK
jgi:hypothetical protein